MYVHEKSTISKDQNRREISYFYLMFYSFMCTCIIDDTKQMLESKHQENQQQQEKQELEEQEQEEQEEKWI